MARTRPGKSGAGAEVEPGFGVGREVEKLQRIDDMAIPDLVRVAGPTRFLIPLPAAKLASRELELLECFT